MGRPLQLCPLMIFRYEELSSFLSDIRERFRVMTLAECDGAPGIILRHDVDLDLAPAHRLALIEHDLGVRSTFFILMTCPLYNPLAADNRAMLREMADRGFEIGLHFDPSVYGDCPDDDLAGFAKQEATLLASAIHQPVRSIAIHNPSVHGKWPSIAGLRSAYDPIYYHPSRYLSDSRRRFREDPRKFVGRADRALLQIVLHPLHYSESGEGYERIMSRYVLDMIERVERNFAVNEVFNESIGEGLIHRVVELIDEELSVELRPREDAP